MTGSFGGGLPSGTWRDRWVARIAGTSARRARLGSVPPPPVTGDAKRGLGIVNGQISLGHSRLVPVAEGTFWSQTAPTRAFEADRQCFFWLDDLAALGTGPARKLARAWVAQWFTAQGHGKGPGWTLPVVAVRLERLVAHAEWLLSGREGVSAPRFERSLSRHCRFAAARFATLPNGPEGLAVAARLVAASARLEGTDILLARAQDALDRACKTLIGPNGTIAGRAPKTLADAMCFMAEAAQALNDAGLGPHPEHARALSRTAPVVRALRHSNGALARFHGGGGGHVARLDAALAGLRSAGLVPVRKATPQTLPMGFARLARGPITVIADMAAPDSAREAAGTAHASTLAFEVTAGACPLVVNCGAGAPFGPDWQEAARETASHSTLVLAGQSSSLLERARGGAMVLTEAPGNVQADLHPDEPDMHVVGAHNGYSASFGLIHARRLNLSLAGDVLEGEDILSAVSEAEKRRFHARASEADGVSFALRFHLHPDVDAHLDAKTGTVALRLPNRDLWHFTHDAGCTIRLDPSVYLEKTRPEPASSRQIVLLGRAATLVTSVRWRLTRDRETPAFAPAETRDT